MDYMKYYTKEEWRIKQRHRSKLMRKNPIFKPKPHINGYGEKTYLITKNTQTGRIFKEVIEGKY